MKKKIIDIATDLSKGKLTTKEAKEELLYLFGVVGRSEQLVCDCEEPNFRWIGDDDDMYEECFSCRKDKAN